MSSSERSARRSPRCRPTSSNGRARNTSRRTGCSREESFSRPPVMMRDDLSFLVQQMIDRGILFDDAQRQFERVFITRALAKTNYNVCKAARMTGLHRNTLSRKMHEYRIKKSA